jgi:hypothetical protein
MSNDTSVEDSPTRSGSGSPAEWDRSHPTVVALSGFFTGMLFITVVPGGVAGVLRLLFTYDTAEDLFPLVLLALVVPIVLVILPRTRRFGAYMWLGMALTALVVLGVTSLVLYFMVRSS